MGELLFEIGTEEIPAGYIQPALDFLAAQTEKKLINLGLGFTGISTYATPRRLTLCVDSIEERQPDRRQEHIGPSTKAGFDADGNPTKAAIGFARSKGLEPSALQVIDTPKGEYLMAVEDVKGQQTETLLPGVLEELTRELVFPKSMRWADTAMSFTRPIQWLTALYAGKVVELTIEDVAAGATTRGHRFMAPQEMEVQDKESYLGRLEEKFVVADMAKRRELVVSEVEQAVKKRSGIAGAAPVLHEGLIDTITNLVERPYGVCGSFDEKFLDLPDEALITSMREHQKYFPVADSNGSLLPRFVAVNNTNVADQELASSGHERVLRARLEDGLFFFNEDKKHTLSSRVEQLQGIVFQHKLGTMLAKTRRVMKVAQKLADAIDPALKDQVTRAAELAKADLLTEMVNEFPSLQGTMGKEYAMLDGEEQSVALAIQEHYMPVRAGSELPSTMTGAIVGLADRLDTLAGCFAIGERPTGNKDAFGLRRQAIGLLAIIKGCAINISLSSFIEHALAEYEGVVEIPAHTAVDILEFIRLRFANEQVASGFLQEVVDAATTVGFDNPNDCLARITALDTIQHQDSFGVLAGSFKRIKNIIKENSDTVVQDQLLSDTAEKELFATLEGVQGKALPLIASKQYSQALTEMLEMKEPVDRFFDEVMVMAEDPQVRQNRLNLLTALGELVLQVGDISRMHVE
ncbi:MAG: glycine--tRNA ligase subunit beta [Desulfobulbus propionicus]|nr:MAG: glycine--tRNA ligase subunit beta [Desulfobulbus propionicus]